MNIADRIQRLRKTKGMSQEELADRVGVSRQAVSKWESGQSMPDMDKIVVMSDYFEVTTDYLLKGKEPIETVQKNGEVLASQVLYIASTALIAIGLLVAFANWYENQRTEDIWGAMIIQVVGMVAYFIGRVISNEKPTPHINFLNIILAEFMPVSMVSGLLSVAILKQGWVAPYPVDLGHIILFGVLYVLVCGLTWVVLRKRQGKPE